MQEVYDAFYRLMTYLSMESGYKPPPRKVGAFPLRALAPPSIIEPIEFIL